MTTKRLTHALEEDTRNVVYLCNIDVNAKDKIFSRIDRRLENETFQTLEETKSRRKRCYDLRSKGPKIGFLPSIHQRGKFIQIALHIHYVMDQCSVVLERVHQDISCSELAVNQAGLSHRKYGLSCSRMLGDEENPKKESAEQEEKKNRTFKTQNRVTKGKPPDRYGFHAKYPISPEPETWTEIQTLEENEKRKWLKAIREEINSLEENNTWELVDLPKGRKSIGSPDVENAYGLDFLKVIPLRVYFGGTREGVDKGLSEEQFEIISFQPFISPDIQPFVLPKGRGCKRSNVQDPPERPNFADKNIMFSAEVIYRVIDRNEQDVNVWSYYSTLTMALDITSQHLAYYYTPWDTKNSDEELEVKAPVHVIFDMKHGYAYQFDDETGNCSITREKSFVPKFELPRNGGSVSLTDPSILFPNDELYYMSKGKIRGLDVNIFEETVDNYVLDKKNGDPEQIKKAIITHSYLVDTEVERNKDSVKNALTQIQMIFRGREGKNVEVLTFNFFGFSTQIRARRRVFNIQQCYRNDDDYVWVTLGFNADKDVLQNINEDGPSIRSNILNALSLQSEINAVRMPIIL
ncbi:uncharacterized protein LOC118204242, partial [Stegodyphus dumicola]|uniref:uncharacterized protein LOC118204242 n=1 Tax=Stegodyphus dumicola TaxID=202533 RepID=UPI0015AF162A